MKRKKTLNKKIIGRVEKVDLPELELVALDAKVDTGAYGCAIHCHHIVLSDDDHIVNFSLLDPSHSNYEGKILSLPVLKKKWVKSSSGFKEMRITVKTRIRLFGKGYLVELSLADRSTMRYPMLLGRKLLQGRFLVDVEQTYLAEPQKEKL